MFSKLRLTDTYGGCRPHKTLVTVDKCRLVKYHGLIFTLKIATVNYFFHVFSIS